MVKAAYQLSEGETREAFHPLALRMRHFLLCEQQLCHDIGFNVRGRVCSCVSPAKVCSHCHLPPDCNPRPVALWPHIRGRSLSHRHKNIIKVGPKGQCESKDSAAGESEQGHAPGGEETLSSLSNLDAQLHKRSQKETNMATCLAGNTARAISSTRQHTGAARGIMMREKFAGLAFRLCALQRSYSLEERLLTFSD